jgi:hypothetical protein
MNKLVEEVIKELFMLPCNLTPNQIQIIERVAERLKNHTTFNQTQNNNSSSRPDRIGDECWYATWVDTNWWWRRGILIVWVTGDYLALVENTKTKQIEPCSRISFSTEAPQ